MLGVDFITMKMENNGWDQNLFWRCDVHISIRQEQANGIVF